MAPASLKRKKMQKKIQKPNNMKKEKKPKKNQMDEQLDGYQQWKISTVSQNIVSIGGVAVNQSIQTYCNNNPDFAVQQCSPSEIYLYNPTMLSTQVTIVFSGDGSKQGVIIIAGHRKPPCAS